MHRGQELRQLALSSNDLGMFWDLILSMDLNYSIVLLICFKNGNNHKGKTLSLWQKDVCCMVESS